MAEVEAHDKNVKMMMGDYKKAMQKMAWPMILSMLITMSYNLVDGILVSILGTNALAAVGFVTPLFMVVNGLANGLGAGAASFISRKIGAKDKDGADLGASQSIFISIFISIIISIIILIFQKNILISLGARGVIDLALQYCTILFAGAIFIMFSSIFAGVLRAEGDVKRALYVMALTAILNIILDYYFIMPWGLNLSVGGVALATVLSSAISGVVLLYWLLIKKDTYVTVKTEYLKPHWDVIKGILIVGIPAALEMMCIATMVVIINAVLSIISDTQAVASYTAGMRIVLFGIVPAVGLSMATIAVAGSSYGAALYERLRNVLFYSLKFGLVLSVGIGLIIFIFAPQLSFVFTLSENSGGLSDLIAVMLRIYFLFFLATPIGLLSGAFFQSLGKGPLSLGLTVIREIILPTIFVLLFTFVFGFGVLGVLFAIVLGKLLGAIIGFLYANYYSNNLIKKYGKEGELVNK